MQAKSLGMLRTLAATMCLLLPSLSQAQCLCERWHVGTPVIVECDCDWYTVKPNGKLTTRPAYTLTDGVLVKSKERAPVGATCDLTKPTKPSNKDLYASYDSTGTVALCSKR